MTPVWQATNWISPKQGLTKIEQPTKLPYWSAIEDICGE